MASTGPERRPATYADIEALPEHVVGEIIDGDLIVSPRPAPRHAVAASGLGGLLTGPFRFGIGGPGGWWILDEPELHLGGHVLVPDIAGWRKQRMPALPETAWFGIAPDWVCEVLSPSTERTDRLKKLAIYAREQVNHVWLVHPIQRLVEVYRRAADLWSLVRVIGDTEEPVGIEPFDAVPIPLHLVWGEPPDVD